MRIKFCHWSSLAAYLFFQFFLCNSSSAKEERTFEATASLLICEGREALNLEKYELRELYKLNEDPDLSESKRTIVARNPSDARIHGEAQNISEDQNIKEAQNLNGVHQEELLKRIFKKWSIFSSDFAKVIEDDGLQFLASSTAVDNAKIDVSQDFSVVIPPSCALRTVLLSRISRFHQENFVDKKFWDPLSQKQKLMALQTIFLQKISIRGALERIEKSVDREFVPPSRVNARALNALFWSKEFSLLNLREFLSKLAELGAMTFPITGINLNLTYPYTFFSDTRLASGVNGFSHSYTNLEFKAVIFGQSISMSGLNSEFSLYPSGEFKCFNVKKGDFYAAEVFENNLRVASSPLEKPVCLYEVGSVQSGYVEFSQKLGLTYIRGQWQLSLGFEVGIDLRALDFDFDQDRNLREVSYAVGTYRGKKQNIKVKGRVVLKSPKNGACAQLIANQDLMKVDGIKYRVQRDREFHCFDINGYLQD